MKSKQMLPKEVFWLIARHDHPRDARGKLTFEDGATCPSPLWFLESELLQLTDMARKSNTNVYLRYMW